MASIVRWLFQRRRVTVGSSSSSSFFPPKWVDNFFGSQNSASDGDSSRATDKPPPQPQPLCTTIINKFSSSQSPIDMTSLSSARTSPWLMLPPAGDDKVYKLYSPAENIAINKVFGGDEPIVEFEEDEPRIVGSSHGWLAVFYFYHRINDLVLSDPITGKPLVKLPNLPLSYNNRMVLRMTLSSSPLQDSCRAMMIFGSEGRLAFCCPGRSTDWTPLGDLYDKSGTFQRSYSDIEYSSAHKLFFCIMTYTCRKCLETPNPRYHRKKEDLPGLFGPQVMLPRKADLEAWDLSDLLSPRIDWAVKDISLSSERDHCLVNPDEPCFHHRYLVLADHSEELYFVIRHINPRMMSDGSFARFIYYGKYRGYDDSYPYKTIDFDVYKIDRDGGKMIYMDGHLDDMVMFVGSADSFAMPASMFPRLKPNSIYFTDANRLVPIRRARSHYGGHDNGVFDYVSKNFSPCGPFPCDYQSIRRTVPPPLWFTTSDISFRYLG